MKDREQIGNQILTLLNGKNTRDAKELLQALINAIDSKSTVDLNTNFVEKKIKERITS